MARTIAWMVFTAFLGMLLAVFAGIALAQGNGPELFLSEYVAGSANNKALEIYNTTAGSIDLHRCCGRQ